MERQKVKKQKTFTYPITAVWVENNVKKSYFSNLYQSKVFILSDMSKDLHRMTPKGMVSLYKKLKRKEKEGKISSLNFGIMMTVSDEIGLLKEVKEEISIQDKVEAMMRVGDTVNIKDESEDIYYRWTITAIDKDNDSITFTSQPPLTGLKDQVKRDGENNTCLFSAFRSTVQFQLYGQ